jgi:hypothetical protein
VVRLLCPDVDRHDDRDDPDATWRAALAWYNRLVGLGFRPLLLDSNGAGGYRVYGIFDREVPAGTVRDFGYWLTVDWKDHGLPGQVEIFPKQSLVTQPVPGEAVKGDCGNWLRIPGRHHKRAVYSRVWDGEKWLEGNDAIDFILATMGDDPALIPAAAAGGRKRYEERRKAEKAARKKARQAAKGAGRGRTLTLPAIEADTDPDLRLLTILEARGDPDLTSRVAAALSLAEAAGLDRTAFPGPLDAIRAVQREELADELAALLCGVDAYATTALVDEIEELAVLKCGSRHDGLCSATYALAGLVKAGALTMEYVLEQLHVAAEENGLAKEGRADEVDDLMASAMDVAETRDLSKIKPRKPATPTPAPTWSPSNVNPGATTADPTDINSIPPAYRYIVGEKDTILSCQVNTARWIVERKPADYVSYDTFLQDILVAGKPVTDQTVVDLAMEIEASFSVPWHQSHVRSALIHLAHKREFSSVARWLDGLVWDGAARVNRFFAEHYGSGDDAYSAECSRVFFLAAVARAYEPGCKVDTLPVLIGEQGIYKSTGIATLCPTRDWFTDAIGALDADKCGENLRGKWLIEFAELSQLNKAALEDVKRFITRQVEHFRPAYGHKAQDFPRCCVFYGTTNNNQPLQDTQNRRFMPLWVKRANIDAIAEARDQIWAEAVSRYKAGEKWWTTDPTLLEEVGSRGRAARNEDAYETVLRDKLVGRDQTTLLEAADWLGLWRDSPLNPVNKFNRAEQTRVGNALAAIGFVKKRRPRPDRSYYYERESDPE